MLLQYFVIMGIIMAFRKVSDGFETNWTSLFSLYIRKCEQGEECHFVKSTSVSFLAYLGPWHKHGGCLLNIMYDLHYHPFRIKNLYE
jgi:hypothetical protein